MIVAMARLRIAGPAEVLADVIGAVQDVGVLHLAEPAVPAPARSPRELRRERQLRRVLEDVAAAREASGAGDAPAPRAAPRRGHLPTLARAARRIRREAERHAAAVRALEDEAALLARYRPLFPVLRRLLEAQSALPGSTVFHLVLRRDQAEALPLLRDALGRLLDGAFHLLLQPLASGETAALLLVPAARAAEVERLLAETRVPDVGPPPGYGATLAQALPGLLARAAALPDELARARAARDAQRRTAAPLLLGAVLAARDALARLAATAQAGRTARAFVLEGWLPRAALPRLAAALAPLAARGVAHEVLSEETWRAEAAPVVLRNPRLFRPFEAITRMLPLPRYGSIDPTPFVAVFFPMFFGLMLGDVGYGLALAGVGLLLRRGAPPASRRHEAGSIALACAAFSVLFGILFGEFLGDLGHRRFGWSPLLFDRGEKVVAFLTLALGLGFAHVLLGLVLGVVAAARRSRHAALGKGVTLAMVVLVGVALLAALDVLPARLATPAAVGLLVAFPVLVLLEGIAAPVELLATLGHVLSYARIMALGTASVMLAVVANRMVGALGSVLVGVLFALLFHLVNFALGLFSPTIHALRLHYVEFFGTFYSPGGVTYAPLAHAAPAAPSA